MFRSWKGLQHSYNRGPESAIDRVLTKDTSLTAQIFCRGGKGGAQFGATVPP
jgi:hypothetical protein